MHPLASSVADKTVVDLQRHYAVHSEGEDLAYNRLQMQPLGDMDRGGETKRMNPVQGVPSQLENIFCAFMPLLHIGKP